MKWLTIQAWSSIIVITVVRAQLCNYQCEQCKESMYYSIDPATGQCLRNDAEIRYFLLGPVYCSVGHNMVHENGSCAVLDSIAKGLREPRYGFLYSQLEVHVDWNASSGCRVFGESLSFVDNTPFDTTICFRGHTLFQIVPVLVIGLLVGLVLAWISTHCARNAVSSDAFDSEVGKAVDFWAGAKLMAADHIVKGSGTRRLTLLFRISSVIANAWLPMLLLIFFNPILVLGLYALLYVIPGLILAGAALAEQPIYLITPPDASLYGIDHIQPDVTKSYLYSAFRPFLMIGLTMGIGGIMIRSGNPAEYTYNVSGYFRAGMMEGPGPLVLDFVFFGTIIGTTIHIIMTFWIIYQAWHIREPGEVISLVKNDQKYDEVFELSKKIVELAMELDEDDSESESSARSVKSKKHMWDHDDLKGVTPLSKLDVFVAMCLAIIDLAAYIYKIWAFIRGGRYVLATVIVIALSESFFCLLFMGNLKRAKGAFHKAAHDGVATYDYLACCQWDDGLAGVPYLMTTLYGLPLVGIHTWFATLSAIFFICTGTRAMGKFITMAIDADMFNVEPADGESDEERTFLHYAATSKQKEEEIESNVSSE